MLAASAGAARTTRRRRRCCGGSTACCPPTCGCARRPRPPDGFDARFSALWRRYAYRIADEPRAGRPAGAPARAGLAAASRPRRDERGGGRAAGEHDFAAFCKKREGATTSAPCSTWPGRGTPTAWRWRPCAPTPSATTWSARWSAAWSRSGRAGGPPRGPAEVLRGRGSRDPAVTVVHAHGLTLEEVGYPPDDELAARADRPGRAVPPGDRRRCAMDEHYFSADPSVAFKRAPVRAEVWGHELGADLAGPGCSPRAGSTSAPRCSSARPSRRRPGRYLDLGCGYGVIGLALAVAVPGCGGHAPSTSTSARCCWRTRTPRRSGVARPLHGGHPGRACPPTRRTTRSGPTRRSGSARTPCTTLLLTWLPRLAPGGRAVLVVGKNLGADSLQRWLGEQGYPTERLASAKGFRVLETRRRAGESAAPGGREGSCHDYQAGREPLRHDGLPLHRPQRAQAAGAVAGALAELRRPTVPRRPSGRSCAGPSTGA